MWIACSYKMSALCRTIIMQGIAANSWENYATGYETCISWRYSETNKVTLFLIHCHTYNFKRIFSIMQNKSTTTIQRLWRYSGLLFFDLRLVIDLAFIFIYHSNWPRKTVYLAIDIFRRPINQSTNLINAQIETFGIFDES